MNFELFTKRHWFSLTWERNDDVDEADQEADDDRLWQECPVCEGEGEDTEGRPCVWCEGSENPGYLLHEAHDHEENDGNS